VVLGVEEARIVHGHDRGLALPLDARRTEIDRAAPDEFAEPLEGCRLRPQHRLAQMHAGLGQRQHLREENALVDFDAVFLALQMLGLRRHLPARRRQPGDQFGGIIDQVLDAPKSPEIAGQSAIDRLGVPLQKRFARLPAIGQDAFRRQFLRRRARRLPRQLGQQVGAGAPEFRAGGGIALEVSDETGLRLQPGGGRFLRQAGGAERHFGIALIGFAGRAFHTPTPRPYSAVLPGHWHKSAMMHFSHSGFRAKQVYRPCRISQWCACSLYCAGTTCSNLCSTSNGFFPTANPVRFPTRKMWVSTAMVGSPKATFSTKLAVLRPTPGSASRASRERGTWLPCSATSR